MKRTIYYILSFTWGIIMTIIGLLAALVLYIIGKKPTMHGPCLCYVVGTGWGGISLGPIMIMSESNAKGDHTKNHEFGHSLQNCIWGPFFPFVIAIPSAIRYHQRENMVKSGQITARELEEKDPYDSIWFEGQATEWGTKYIDKF